MKTFAKISLPDAVLVFFGYNLAVQKLHVVMYTCTNLCFLLFGPAVANKCDFPFLVFIVWYSPAIKKGVRLLGVYTLQGLLPYMPIRCL